MTWLTYRWHIWRIERLIARLLKRDTPLWSVWLHRQGTLGKEIKK